MQRKIEIIIRKDDVEVFHKSPASPQDVIPALQLFEDGNSNFCMDVLIYNVVSDQPDVVS